MFKGNSDFCSRMEMRERRENFAYITTRRMAKTRHPPRTDLNKPLTPLAASSDAVVRTVTYSAPTHHLDAWMDRMATFRSSSAPRRDCRPHAHRPRLIMAPFALLIHVACPWTPLCIWPRPWTPLCIWPRPWTPLCIWPRL